MLDRVKCALLSLNGLYGGQDIDPLRGFVIDRREDGKRVCITDQVFDCRWYQRD